MLQTRNLQFPPNAHEFLLTVLKESSCIYCITPAQLDDLELLFPFHFLHVYLLSLLFRNRSSFFENLYSWNQWQLMQQIHLEPSCVQLSWDLSLSACIHHHGVWCCEGLDFDFSILCPIGHVHKLKPDLHLICFADIHEQSKSLEPVFCIQCPFSLTFYFSFSYLAHLGYNLSIRLCKFAHGPVLLLYYRKIRICALFSFLIFLVSAHDFVDSCRTGT